MPRIIERRFLLPNPGRPAQVQARAAMLDGAADNAAPMISGYAAVFGQVIDLGYGFDETVAPGAFTDALARPDDVRALINHDESLILGRNTAGTLRLMQDDQGLAVEIEPPSTTYAMDLLTVMRRGDVTQMSFAFTADLEEWDETGPRPLRTIKAVTLYDVSVVTYPAYDMTEAEAKAAAAARPVVIPRTRFDATLQRRRLSLDLATRLSRPA